MFLSAEYIKKKSHVLICSKIFSIQILLSRDFISMCETGTTTGELGLYPTFLFLWLFIISFEKQHLYTDKKHNSNFYNW